jgi:hypothetical protein
MKNIIKFAVIAFAPIAAFAQNFNGVTVVDSTFSLLNGATAVTTGTTDARFGIWNSGTSTFTPFYGTVYSASNDGYAGDPFGSFEIFLTLGAGDNTTIASGSALAVSISLRPYQSNYEATATEAILIDSGWTAPLFSLSAENSKEYFFTANTTAVKGQYSFNGGNEIINLTAVPEPSTYAALAGVAVLGLAALRRRRA